MADKFLKRSENWRNVFDPSTGFMRGRNADGSWVTPFDANAINSFHQLTFSWEKN